MSFEHYIRSGQKWLKCGYTTGTCASLAAKAAVHFLLTGEIPDSMEILTPKGLIVNAPILDFKLRGNAASCSVQKYAGDDADVTDGYLITAEVSKSEKGITIDGGEGVGRVTKAGLDQPVGAAAINRVPREMIRSAVLEECKAAHYNGGLTIIISVPQGEEIAKKTFNPNLGIIGGISILGTSGIVEPMSQQAIVDTIEVEIKQARASGSDHLILTPGNYGIDFLKSSAMYAKGVPFVKYSNFIGDALDISVSQGFKTVLIVGHMGKLVKLAGGIMNTHSKVADCRMELICAHSAVCGADSNICSKIMDSTTTDAALAILDESSLRQAVIESLMAAIQKHLDRRCQGLLKVGAVMFSNEYGYIGESSTVKEILNIWNKK